MGKIHQPDLNLWAKDRMKIAKKSTQQEQHLRMRRIQNRPPCLCHAMLARAHLYAVFTRHETISSHLKQLGCKIFCHGGLHEVGDFPSRTRGCRKDMAYRIIQIYKLCLFYMIYTVYFLERTSMDYIYCWQLKPKAMGNNSEWCRMKISDLMYLSAKCK